MSTKRRSSNDDHDHDYRDDEVAVDQSDKKPQKRCRSAVEQSECVICYSASMSSVFLTLDCGDILCRVCYDKLRNPVCPFCRGPIDPKRFPEAVEMERRHREDIEAENAAAARALEQALERDEAPRIVPGSQVWRAVYDWLIDHIGVFRLSSQTNLRDDWNVMVALYDFLRARGLHEGIVTRSVTDLVLEVH
jgi:hypothetical protein